MMKIYVSQLMFSVCFHLSQKQFSWKSRWLRLLSRLWAVWLQVHFVSKINSLDSLLCGPLLYILNSCSKYKVSKFQIHRYHPLCVTPQHKFLAYFAICQSRRSMPHEPHEPVTTRTRRTVSMDFLTSLTFFDSSFNTLTLIK